MAINNSLNAQVTQYDILVGGSSNQITNIGPGTAGQLLQSGGAGANPSYTTTTYPLTTTVSQPLYSSSNSIVAGLSTGNNGVLITSAAGVPSLLANGTTGQVLTATTSNPAKWATAPGTGNLVLISSQTANNVASIAFTSGISATYNNYLLLISEMNPITNSITGEIQFSTNGGSSYISSSYSGGLISNQISATNTWVNSNITYYFSIGLFTTAEFKCFYINLFNLTSGGQVSVTGIHGATYSSGYFALLGTTNTNTNINAFKIFFSSGNISSGVFTLYGILE